RVIRQASSALQRVAIQVRAVARCPCSAVLYPHSLSAASLPAATLPSVQRASDLSPSTVPQVHEACRIADAKSAYVDAAALLGEQTALEQQALEQTPQAP